MVQREWTCYGDRGRSSKYVFSRRGTSARFV